ncbi:hypothetical protein SAMN04488120_101326 [Fontimonas thermophila]|uniref:Uncharacterized protein n=1 Tax=Fontimonas thermophila TaxID=1076937 RepID=A0A1I2HDP9_9GAMM|nr:hypothetical protein [Fontimonas thermophila]SFF27430.1 hypothetical protein SAMN04488120_101326 [Fontimonas thermophila]
MYDGLDFIGLALEAFANVVRHNRQPLQIHHRNPHLCMLVRSEKQPHELPAAQRDALAVAIRSQPETGEAVARYARAVLSGQPVEPYRTMGLLTQAEAEAIAGMTGVEALRRELYDWTVGQYAPLHVRTEHGDEATESARGQRAVTAADYARLPSVILEPDRRWVEDGGATLLLDKWFEDEGERVVAAFAVQKKRRMVTLKSMRIIRRAPRAQRP